MAEFYTRFIRETMDEAGQVAQWSYQYEEDFNYGYDVIDPLGDLDPTAWPCSGGTTGGRRRA